MKAFSNIHIFNDSGRPIPTYVSIDGKDIHGVVGIDYHADTDSIPRVVLEINSINDSGIDINNAELMIKFHPETVVEAVEILQRYGIEIDEDKLLNALEKENVKH